MMASAAMRLPVRISSMLGEHEFEDRFGEARQREQIGRADEHGRRQHGGRGGAVGERAAEEIAGSERDQHGRDQRRPGIDAAAEIRIEIARAEHLEAHHDGAGDEGDRVEQDGQGAAPLGEEPALSARVVARSGIWSMRASSAVQSAAILACPDGTGTGIAVAAGRSALHLPRATAYIGPRRLGICHAFAPTFPRRALPCRPRHRPACRIRPGSSRSHLAERASAVLFARGPARRARGRQRLRRQDRCQPQSDARRIPALLRDAGHAGHAGRARRSGPALARLGRDRRCVRPRGDQQPRHRGRRPGEGLARRQARVRGRDRAQGRSAPTSRCCASRRRARSFPCWNSPIPMRCRWATWCSPSAIRSGSARP